MSLHFHLACITAASAFLLPAAGAAQGGSAANDAQPLVSSGIAARIKAGTWTYVTRLMGGGPPRRLGFRTIEIRPSTFGGMDAWLIVDSQQLQAATLAESLYVARRDLSPLHRVAHSPGQDVVADFASDSIRTRFAGDSGTSNVAIGNEPRVVADLLLLQLLVGRSPVHAGWHGTARLAAVGPHEGGVVAVNLSTIGEETVRAPDGDFACWLVAVDIGKGRQRLWVRKSDGVVIKARVPVVGMGDAEVENLLAQNGVQP